MHTYMDTSTSFIIFLESNSSVLWWRSSRVVRTSDSQGNSSIPASSDTVESKWRKMKQCWIQYIGKKSKKSSCKFISSSVLFRFASIFLLHFAYFPFIFASDFFLDMQFCGFFSFRFAFFVYFLCVFASDLCYFASMWNKRNHAFFRFQAKQNFRFNFNIRFQSENEGAP